MRVSTDDSCCVWGSGSAHGKVDLPGTLKSLQNPYIHKTIYDSSTKYMNCPICFLVLFLFHVFVVLD